MKRKIVNGFLLMAFVVSSVSTFVACKDYDEDVYVDLQSQIAAGQTLGENLKKKVELLEGATQDLEAWQASMKDEFGENIAGGIKKMLQDALQDYYTRDSVDSIVYNLDTLVNSLKTRIEALEQKTGCACPSNLESRIIELEKLLTLPGKIDTLDEKVKRALNMAELDSIWIASVKDSLYSNAQVDSLVAQLRVEQDSVLKIANDALKLAQKDSTWFKGLETKVDSFIHAVDSVIPLLQNRIDSLELRVDTLEMNLKNDLQSMITGIIVQAAESPVLGYLNTPLGVNATMLAVYYGKPAENWDFPATNDGPYLNDGDLNRWKEGRALQVLGDLTKVNGYIKGDGNVTVVTKDGAEGNAGTLYLTINPANVSFAGQTLKLMDSQDNKAPATLSPLKLSDRVLNFGFSRAVKNGFYEAAATIEAADVEKAKMNIDYTAIAEDIKDMVKNRSLSNVLELGATVLKNASNVTPAYAVTASWKSETLDDTLHLYSQYNVAATAVKPLGFGTIKSYWPTVSNVPGLGRLQDLVGRMIDNIKINIKMPDFKSMEDVYFENVTIDPKHYLGLKVKLTLRIDGDGKFKIVGDENHKEEIYTVYFEGGKFDHAESATNKNMTWPELAAVADVKDETISTDLNSNGTLFTCVYYFGDDMKTVVDELVNALNGTLDDANKDFADLLNELKNMGDINGSINDAKASLKEQINSYLTRLNNRLANWINRAAHIGNLALAVKTDSKVGLMSQSKHLPTQASGSITLYPTTYNLELIAPAYKKFVAVTDVFNADGSNADINEAKAANNGTNMAKVIDGETTCTLTGKQGLIYEVTYTAVDYYGTVAINKYYVKF